MPRGNKKVTDNQRHNLLTSSSTLINALFTGNNAVFNTITKHNFFTLFDRKKHPKNRYTQKQPMTPLRSKLKIFFRNLKILKVNMPKKITPKSQVKIKPSFHQYPFFKYF